MTWEPWLILTAAASASAAITMAIVSIFQYKQTQATTRIQKELAEISATSNKIQESIALTMILNGQVANLEKAVGTEQALRQMLEKAKAGGIDVPHEWGQSIEDFGQMVSQIMGDAKNYALEVLEQSDPSSANETRDKLNEIMRPFAEAKDEDNTPTQEGGDNAL